MKFAEDACRCLETAVRGGMPVLLLSAAQAGATSPAALAGTVVQAVAECLAGLVYINCVVPGAVAIWGPWPFVSDLRTGAMSGGSGEQALITSGCAQMGHFYNLTVGSAAGMCDSKLPDMQAGYEKGVTAGISAMTGINLLYESGRHACLAARLLPGKPAHRQRHAGLDQPQCARHRSQRRDAVGRRHRAMSASKGPAIISATTRR